SPTRGPHSSSVSDCEVNPFSLQLDDATFGSDAQVHVRVACLEAPEPGQQPKTGYSDAGAECHGRVTGGGAQRAERVLQLFECRIAGAEQSLALPSESDRAVPAHEKLDLQPLLEGTNLPAQRRLRQAQLERCGADTHAPADCDKAP